MDADGEQFGREESKRDFPGCLSVSPILQAFLGRVDTGGQELFGLIPPLASVCEADGWVRPQSHHLLATQKMVAQAPEFRSVGIDEERQAASISKFIGLFSGLGVACSDGGKGHMGNTQCGFGRYP